MIINIYYISSCTNIENGKYEKINDIKLYETLLYHKTTIYILRDNMEEINEKILLPQIIPLEKAILEESIKDILYIGPFQDKLKYQISCISSVSRDFTGAGFYSYFRFGNMNIKEHAINIKDGYGNRLSWFVEIKDTSGIFANLLFNNGIIKCIDFVCIENAKDYIIFCKNVDAFFIKKHNL